MHGYNHEDTQPVFWKKKKVKNVFGLYQCHPNKHIDTLLKKLVLYEGWNFNSGNYLFTTDTK